MSQKRLVVVRAKGWPLRRTMTVVHHQQLADAGFVDAEFYSWTGYRTSACTEGALLTAKAPESK